MLPNLFSRPRAWLLLCGLMILLEPAPRPARGVSTAHGTIAAQAAGGRSGQNDFDFEIGSWHTSLKLLERPLSGSSSWAEYEGTSIVREVLGGRANLVELDVTGPTGRIEGVSLRLYNPETRQWSLNFANARNGVLTPPVIGEFREGRGEFYAQESLNGRAILSRFVITVLSADSCRFEQAFSDDGGKTWEVNWIAIDTRMPE